MVHTKCSYEKGRGRPTTEFYLFGRPQIYCMGWIDPMNDEPISVCKKCPDFVAGQQCAIDFLEYRKREEMNER